MARILFFEKSKIDLDLGAQVVITPTDSVATDTGAGAASYIRNRDNVSGWGTTGSSDAAGTTLAVMFGDQQDIDSLFMLVHNFKSFTVQYYDTSNALQSFSVPISTSGLAVQSYSPGGAFRSDFFQFGKVTATGLLITVNSTITANADKFMAQLVPTLLIGPLLCQPFIQKPMLAATRTELTTGSGKRKIQKNAGWFECTLTQDAVMLNDWALIETLYSYNQGFLMWLNGNDFNDLVSQYPHGVRAGYRPQDLFLCDFADELTPEYGGDGRYGFGMNLNARIVEITN
jgi:hypothetical protein